MEWFEELDFDENPFDTNPKRHPEKLVGLTEISSELMYRLESGAMVFLQGKKGFGKTSLLWNVIRNKRWRGKIIYVDCKSLSEDLNIEKLLINKQGLKGILFKVKPKDMVLLLDNVGKLSKINTERVKYFFDQGYLRSVVFTGEDFKKADFSKSLKQRIGSRILEIEPVDKYQAIAIIRNRIHDLNMISDDLIEEVFKKSDKNPKKLLENCEQLFSSVIESNEDKITKKHLKLIEG
ncbi:MAG: hypothetical protein MAG795_00756 [Candidatus Woesearchaeota archaeon]|nr:hypothetical protein [Candidatus Woesearchaeota archaeon]